jgi:tetratricopeptide (TPR) repeat protein
MKIPTLLRLCLIGSVCLPIVFAAVLETNVEPAQAAAPASAVTPAPVVIPELDELREQLRSMQRSNEEMQRSNEQASEKWAAMAQQNASLSNVLTGLQQTLVAQKERELELGKQSNSLYLKIIGGAAVAVFLVFLFSYWFQLRCLNRVMELSRSLPAMPPHEPALLEQENPATSKLLNAMKLLEHRLEQLEVPGTVVGASTNGGFSESASAHSSTLLNPVPVETTPPSNVSLLMAKGQILLDTDRLQEAVGCFQEAITVDPTNSEAHLKKGIALERMNRLDLALNSYEEALRLNPKRTIANVYKARVLAALHRYDEAISVYDSALGRKPGKTETPVFVS